MKKIVVGAAGKPASGKETFGKEIVRLAARDGFTAKHLVFSDDILRPTIRLINTGLEKNGCTVRNLPVTTIDAILRLWGIETMGADEARLLAALCMGFGATSRGPFETGRKETQILAQIMVRQDTFGADALANAAGSLAIAAPAQYIVIDGVRWLADEVMIRYELAKRDRLDRTRTASPRLDAPPWTPHEPAPSVRGLIAYICANVKVRFERAKARRRDRGEADVTWEEFLKQDNAENEIYIEEIGVRAEIKIVNNGTTEADKLGYLQQIGATWETQLRPLLERT